MYCRLLLDTNILLDAIVEERPEHYDTWKLLEWCNGQGGMGMACPLSYKDLYYVLQRELPEWQARAAVKKLMDYLVVAGVDSEIVNDAINSNEPDFEDGLIRSCAEINGADFIITRDKDAFADTHLKVMSSREFMELVDSEDRQIFEYFVWD